MGRGGGSIRTSPEIQVGIYRFLENIPAWTGCRFQWLPVLLYRCQFRHMTTPSLVEDEGGKERRQEEGTKKA
jgi:hypothetical protein